MRLLRVISVVMGCVMALTAALAQTVTTTPRTDLDKIPSYELVSIHLVKDATATPAIDDEPDGLNARASTLRSLIAEAYGFSLGLVGEQELVGLPAWGKTVQFEIHAKVDAADVPRVAELTKAETMMVSVRQLVTHTPSFRMVMLQRLLEDRFHLKVHYELRVMSLYELTLAKGGVRMKVAHPENPESGSMSLSSGRMEGSNVPMGFIPMIFALALERPVEDKTGTGGNYDFEMHWTPDGDAQSSGGAESAPSLFTAVQEQMGLKLQAGKGPVWVVVVDHAEMPSDN